MEQKSLQFELHTTSLFARICAYILIACASSLVLALLTGVLLVGHIPAYGMDIEPALLDSSLLDILQVVSLLLLAISFLALPAWILLIVHLFIVGKQQAFERKRLWILTLIAIAIFPVLKQTSAFAWLMD